MSDDLETLREQTVQALAAATDQRAWDAVRVATLGKSGTLTALLKQLGRMTPDERRTRGAALNRLRDELSRMIDARGQELEAAALNARLAAERVDVTLPCAPAPEGLLHPITRTIEEMAAIFGSMGFTIAEGPDIESDWHNFSALNTPAHHPARTDQDTFYLPAVAEGQPERVLRTQTSGVQIRTMLGHEPPIRIIAPGRTYRADHDATHSPMFHQCEGLVIDRGITLGHLKGCLSDFLRAFFQMPDLPVRFRASYFPFTEPSMEIDIGWSRKTGQIGTGGDWLEVLGAGMVHPRVLANCGLDARQWQGFAFGMGIERLTMLRHGIPDLRSFYESDVRWLRHYGTSPLSPALLHEGL
ncbi:Phenylalanyl-tRNA synthetase alpha chain [Gluconacetobacter sp. SXCC-1]|uniref:Phenylalanine--tRNA ligase alpha subunit n=1 Tax=Komagataeibacter rhaeticus TaxID=215221 RepID=A0A181CB64_9PROT|nr:phenylalanine--tRNA ligase subunit alpha [Komagataeibacter rhaeticus]ATU72519.1 phenylalanine--tRNA ligase subunit alpha [Komagataeibacter xylinus]EGG74865.1 Phenylalanyl-tRNA synthetase alpha chain [Gluconacetobacter sp. SXCC-1]QIP35572.1 phenylalanine--tRNA ligase subunit alpha [Komagataeibacter rhaeticus]QOC45327.1 phenylalanine--tRNA ligase subunit alpha [Komagataeibacter rhaeticus]WPP22267.1 phenylalanine--tRNA ligase subunit alpha [Komagataeibacter rhaeticus]